VAVDVPDDLPPLLLLHAASAPDNTAIAATLLATVLIFIRVFLSVAS
jgi:hypothetical protein